MNNPSKIVIDALEEMISTRSHDESKIALYFDQSYEQVVNGECLDYRSFIQHIAVLKEHISRIELSILKIVSEGDTVFTHHTANVVKPDGTESQFEVFARFTLCAGKIVRCEELTRMISGASSDRDLGSRY
ncbi:conserved protein of unknown function [Xenorhabdus poinarii G6]|uniref:SnoaL-like domain-containing protein n=1 Tax=Xenorhabdus poinarii G6 TaxID=1354304 RepID=A0A068R558_9GAMM|nr:nuclear transport factor 2 family protein [Xenorhabdus poinarii]CDG22056.1 conserved protein of unknown function [Xenorhabdus poinarii G6]